MSVEGLEHCTKDQLIDELINRQTFVGVVVYHREDAKAGRLEPGEIVMTKSPPLPRAGVEQLLQLGQSVVPKMFGGAAGSVEETAGAFPLHFDGPPLRVDEGGAIRIGSSRISLDLLVEQYENGMSPDDMIRAYDTLMLADVHAVVAYYLRHRDEVQAYLKRREQEALALRAKIEGERPRITPQELIARSSAREKDNAAAGK
jgi:uncharacterized protein (DUF433 family)